ncbi:unnamed protein product [Paramecium sonneborni]|uniref:Uncharacterized protein n=1 Tax=Paramecium sonneborni TaxID=65129 RepID=A0A8S1JTP3_9CILI|nr:unnamed protein product [Paramecium sonneborni]
MIWQVVIDQNLDFCISNSNTDADKHCISASSVTKCEQIYLGSGNYNDANCNEIKSECTVYGESVCINRTCENASVFTYNHDNCNKWFNNCTVNNENNECILMKQKCTDQNKSSCLHSMEGVCVVVNNFCVKKTCNTAKIDSNYDTDFECSNYLKECTVTTRLGGCQARNSCQLYKSSIQCKFNSKGEKCFWNPSDQTCVDLNCENIEKTPSYDSHDECFDVDATLGCTVRSQGTGCMSRGQCGSYTKQEQCRTNQNGEACVWNTNDMNKPVCQDKSCTSAPSTFKTHNDCYAYYNTNTIKCTVFAGLSEGNTTLGGCQETSNCNSYIDKEQCQINANRDLCGWNGTSCADKSCATAPATTDYDDDSECRTYFNNKCTVSQTGQGCVDIPITCEIMTQKQCYFNQAGYACYWTGTTCITKSCDNAPDSTTTTDECNTYLSGCTLDAIKCKTQICEDFNFTTDELCKQAMQTCTTNGIYCVTRGSCLQALNQAGCVTSSKNEQCEWIQGNTIEAAYCTIKTCKTAPITLITVQECQQYFTNCTTKKGGGCIEKSTCSAVTIDSACTDDINGKPCIWENISNYCRNKSCKDFTGINHSKCQEYGNNCTSGPNDKCIEMQNCEFFKNKNTCILGIDGPCLWIDKYMNNDGSMGACFQYTSCQSLSWSTDDQCKQISNYCTTDGQKCIAITLCAETNTNGGCVTGYDGQCIQTVPVLNSLDSKICKLFTSCADALYLTHQECQIANRKCTTNGTSSCIPIGTCSSYQLQAACNINDKGVIHNFGVIISTGMCAWDQQSNNCRDQQCTDLNGLNHEIYYSQLSTCTSDGTKCLIKETCSKYTNETVCTNAFGTDGKCFWDSIQCRLITCADIQNGTSNDICSSFLSNCISDGTVCIPKSNCSSYKAESICKNGLDGICYWEKGSVKNNNTSKCRQFLCTDIQNGRTTQVCQDTLKSCIFNGIFCIPKSNCSVYISKTACNSGGLDGICVFTQSTGFKAIPGIGTCALMTQCEQAHNDQNACQAVKDRCSWTSKTKNENVAKSSQCFPQKCATNFETNGNCTSIYDWDKKSIQFCNFENGQCKDKDPSDLSQNDCLMVSHYTYTWNTSTNKCQSCSGNQNNSINNESPPIPETKLEQILSLIVIAMVQVCF